MLFFLNAFRNLSFIFLNNMMGQDLGFSSSVLSVAFWVLLIWLFYLLSHYLNNNNKNSLLHLVLTNRSKLAFLFLSFLYILDFLRYFPSLCPFIECSRKILLLDPWCHRFILSLYPFCYYMFYFYLHWSFFLTDCLCFLFAGSPPPLWRHLCYWF